MHSLVAAILGEMETLSGRVLFPKQEPSIAFVAQQVGETCEHTDYRYPLNSQAWILNATVRDNILFGLPYDEVRYWQIVQACQLAKDLHMLPAGDLTEVGEKGINLSGAHS